MIKVYHNPRCSKSRCALEILEKEQTEYEVIKYLEDPPTISELKELIKQLGIQPIDLVRKNEPIWKQEFKEKALTDAEIISAMVNNPKLIERPILIKDGKAIIGRPTELIVNFL